MMNTELLNLVNEMIGEIEFKPKTEVFNASNHGSSCGEEVEIVTYWNTFKCSWTSKETLIEDYIIHKLRPTIKKAL